MRISDWSSDVCSSDLPRRPDLLIEHLHLIQDRYGHLSARHLRALSSEMKLPMAAVYEVASFYAHFDIVLEGEAPPPPLTIRLCDSLPREMMGAQDLLQALQIGRASCRESVCKDVYIQGVARTIKK